MKGERERTAARAGNAERAGAPRWAALCGARAEEEKGRTVAGRCGRKEEKGGRAQLGHQRASAGRGRKKRLGQNLGLG